MGSVEYIDMVQEKDRLQALVNAVMILRAL